MSAPCRFAWEETGRPLKRPLLPDWRLPAGVSHGLWDYAQADHIANEYDEYFAYNQLFRFDEDVLLKRFVRPGTLVDLGCGTGRLTTTFGRRGFRCIAVDLSMPMLRVVGQKSLAANVPTNRLLANMVELGCLASHSADYCIIMFSSLGMIAGNTNRQRVLEHARRILKPGGQLAIHVHNRWYNLFDPQGRQWLLRSMLGRGAAQGLEPGDKIFHYRGIPRMRLHLFTRRELSRLLHQAHFKVRTLISLDTNRQQTLRTPWWFGRIRANGWIAICE